ncbi:hypothetical protein IST455A_01879 [Burkholderia multivorans]|uniref:DUF2214 family protein n=1 Tax=Burkholderia multivorans TaxID=87883 RepID=UPI0006A5BF5A|nr:DUF2214 family protein [Burkholderia multivorans]KOE25821.1 membrane protein [Burkholderia multivorans R-20526]MBU9242576.1 DUF2214 family protein [Burkholderia multivorans]MBU9584472.1 DUF2214 family protein [Burkholderia multivorans]MCO1371562.1 DUF2214 family protein [Burkholderia multivorans]MCO1457190.1 DUF2214 family protein [Burkholderia multivorans]
MIVRWLLAAVHLSAFGVAFAAIAARNRALRRLIASAQAGDLPGVFKADTVWGLSALVLIVTGLMRAFGGYEKGSAYYLHAPFFHLKMTALVLILVLEIVPMLGLIRWRIAARQQRMPDIGRARTYVQIGHWQAVLVIVIVFAAAGMARGVWAAG